MKMEPPNRTSTPVREGTPAAVRPGGVESGKKSLENDIRDAVGLGIQDSEASSSGENEFGTTS